MTMDQRSKDLRKLIVRLLVGGTRGHLGPAMSIIEILRVLYDSFLNFDYKDPKWEDRDRLILSKGHGCLALYALLVDKQFFHPNGDVKLSLAQDSLLGISKLTQKNVFLK